uniref:Lectizyme n=1 Tax=Glossina pallidipes TaxID=7398 RepID=A0A1A9Z843_GLOPL
MMAVFIRSYYATIFNVSLPFCHHHCHRYNRLILQQNHPKSTIVDDRKAHLSSEVLRRNLLHDARIVGGFRPKIDNYAKYMIFIVKTTGRTKYFGSKNYCGGTIITPNYILTAAHCVEKGYNIKTIRVIAGTRRRLRRAANVQRRRVQRKILHPDYPQASGCDIALMQLKTKLDIDGKHRAIAPLEFDEYPVFGQHCIAAGWGTIYNNGPCPNDILYVKMVVIGIEPSKFVLNRHSDYAQAACSGDSGGPLFCRGISNKAIKTYIHAMTKTIFPVFVFYEKEAFAVNNLFKNSFKIEFCEELTTYYYLSLNGMITSFHIPVIWIMCERNKWSFQVISGRTHFVSRHHKIKGVREMHYQENAKEMLLKQHSTKPVTVTEAFGSLLSAQPVGSKFLSSDFLGFLFPITPITNYSTSLRDAALGLKLFLFTNFGYTNKYNTAKVQTERVELKPSVFKN